MVGGGRRRERRFAEGIYGFSPHPERVWPCLSASGSRLFPARSFDGSPVSATNPTDPSATSQSSSPPSHFPGTHPQLLPEEPWIRTTGGYGIVLPTQSTKLEPFGLWLRFWPTKRAGLSSHVWNSKKQNYVSSSWALQVTICFRSFTISWFRQGIAKHILETAERDAFIVALKRLAEYYGRLPRSMMIADNEVKIPVPSGSSGTRMGSYKGQTVVVKTFRVAEQDNFQKIRKVSIGDIPPFGTRSRPSFSSDSVRRSSSGA